MGIKMGFYPIERNGFGKYLLMSVCSYRSLKSDWANFWARPFEPGPDSRQDLSQIDQSEVIGEWSSYYYEHMLSREGSYSQNGHQRLGITAVIDFDKLGYLIHFRSHQADWRSLKNRDGWNSHALWIHWLNFIKEWSFAIYHWKWIVRPEPSISEKGFKEDYII